MVTTAPGRFGVVVVAVSFDFVFSGVAIVFVDSSSVEVFDGGEFGSEGLVCVVLREGLSGGG